MCQEPTRCPAHDAVSIYERLALLVLLDTDCCCLWSRDELERELLRDKGNRVHAAGAIDNLYAAGLVHLSGDLVLPTRPLRRVDELYPLCI